MPIGKEIKIGAALLARCDPAILQQKERGAVIERCNAVFGNNAFGKRNGSGGLIERAGRAAQVAALKIRYRPAAPQGDALHSLSAQVIVENGLLRAHGKHLPFLRSIKPRLLEITIPNLLRRLIAESLGSIHCFHP